MEFVRYEEARDLLSELGVQERKDGEERLYLHWADDAAVIHLHLACPESVSQPHNGAQIVTIDKSRLPSVVEHIIQKLHLNQVLLIPVARWRKVFDTVAFDMASNENWQEVDAAATVELNRRDPLLCEPKDFHTVHALLNAVLANAEGPDQGLMLTTTSTPLLVEIVPDGAARISVGNQVLADEVVETFGQP